MSKHAAIIEQTLQAALVMPVIRIDDLAHAVPLANALVEGGLRVLEVTLRTPIALEAIARIARDVPQAIVGAGTVQSAADLDSVAAAGARFAISPGATPALYAAAAARDLPWIPAVATASEIMQGLEHGHRYFKFFSAATSGGVAALSAFAGPFASARFCPTGGIDAVSAPSYFAQPNVVCVGGSWMLPKEALAQQNWTQISMLANAAARLNPRYASP